MSRRRRIVIAMVVISVVALLIPYIHHRRLRAAVDSYISELKDKGEPMELARLIPPPTPLEQNSASVFLAAMSRLKEKSIAESNPPPVMRMVAPGRAMIGWRQPDIRSVGWATNTWKDLGNELESAKSGLDSLQSLINRPVLDFDLDYRQGPSLPVPHLIKLKQAAWWLSAAALYNLHEDRSPEAGTDVRAMLAIIKGQTNERLIISQLVRIAIAQMAAGATWEILQHPKVSETDLAGLQADWQSLEFIRVVEPALSMERYLVLRTVDEFRQKQSPFVSMRPSGIGPDLIRAKWNGFQWRWFWSYADEKRALQTLQVIIDAARMVETNGSFRPGRSFAQTNFALLGFDPSSLQEKGHRIDFEDSETRWLLSEGAVAQFRTLTRAVTVETWRNVVITAIALKRYELGHRQLPATLNELTSNLLKSIPKDYMDGQPLRYRLNADGTFLLYSIGEDGKDDGGDPNRAGESKSWSWQSGRDWVWPQPATAEEIKADEDRMAALRAPSSPQGLSSEEKRRLRYGLPAPKIGNTNKSN